MLGSEGAGIRLSSGSGDSNIQLTNNFASTVSGWVIKRDESAGSILNLLYDNNIVGGFDQEGGMRYGGLGAPEGGVTISAGVIALGSFNYLSVSGEGGVADTVGTITGGNY